MTDDRMALIELIEKGADCDLVREMPAFAAERIMELEVEARTGAGHGNRSPARTNHRNGYRERVDAFVARPIEGEWPYLWIDATYLRVRDGGRIVSTAAIIAVGVNSDRRREGLGVATGPTEAEVFWKGSSHARSPIAVCAASGWSSPTIARGCGRRRPRCSTPRSSAVGFTGCATHSPMPARSNGRRSWRC